MRTSSSLRPQIEATEETRKLEALPETGLKLPALLEERLPYESQQWAYHATLRRFLPSIALNGLCLGEGDQIFVEPDEGEAVIYLEPGGVMLRFPVDGYGCTSDGECVVNEPVPPERIEVRQGARWVPVKNSQQA